MPYTLGELFTQVMNSKANSSAIPDVQIDGTSIVNNGIAAIPIASSRNFGVIKQGSGAYVNYEGRLSIDAAVDTDIKSGNVQKPIVTTRQHISTYYGLAKLAGVDLASETVTVGTYPTAAKTAIKSMLGVETVTTVSGSTPTITGVANTRYICGEVSTISITPPQSGIIDVRFDSGSTAATLTVPNTVKWPGWFDPTDLDTNCTYEINIMDGIYGSVMVWA